MACGRRCGVALSQCLREGAPQRGRAASALVPQSGAEFALPAQIGDYTDFYASIHHATAVGQAVPPGQAAAAQLQVGADRLPRARLLDRRLRPGRSPPARPDHAARRATRRSSRPTQRLDYELEVGRLHRRGQRARAARSRSREAEDHVFGLCLLNDWSARDIQAWEYQPLGPFLAKNFATTVSPWVVTLEALAPFRAAVEPAARRTRSRCRTSIAQQLRAGGAIDMQLEVALQTAAHARRGRRAAAPRRRTNFRHSYWTRRAAGRAPHGQRLQPASRATCWAPARSRAPRRRRPARCSSSRGRQAAAAARERRDAHVPGRRRPGDSAGLVPAAGTRSHRVRRGKRHRARCRLKAPYWCR